jgi:hypothetical protein
MTDSQDPVVLIAKSGELLAVLCARLALSGETPVTAAASDDSRLDTRLRSTAVLIVEAACLSQGLDDEGLAHEDPALAVAMLRSQGWNGKLLLLVDAVPDYPGQDNVGWVSMRGGAAAVVKALAELRG